MVNRFREELNRGRDLRTSTAMTVATAGKAVFFSGVTVAIGLMGMLFFENTGLPSLGIGDISSVRSNDILNHRSSSSFSKC